MKVNVGGNDRIARLIGGVVLLVLGGLGYAGQATLAVGPVPQALGSTLVALVGVVLLATGLSRRCIINSVLGRNTAR
ncbi:YgaP-like transmembrane domain [Halobacteriales archaeon Cl-PHB]